MRKAIFILIVSLFFTSCNHQNNPKGNLKIILENLPKGTVLNLIDIESGTQTNRITVLKDTISLDLLLPEPRFFGIWEDNPKYEKYRKYVWLENSDIKITGNYDYFSNSKVEGSNSDEIYKEFRKLEKTYNFSSSEIKTALRITKDARIEANLTNDLDSIRLEYKKLKRQLFQKYIENEASFYMLALETTSTNPTLDKNELKSIYAILPDKFKISPKGEIINEFIGLNDPPKIGEKFIDFSQQTTDGKTISISDNLGKYTILEFWASSCGPCRMRHPTLRKVYNEYHDQGLNIIGVSSDANLNDLKEAITADSIPWINISDLRGVKNKGYLIYGIKFIPQSILLDQNGIIIDNNFSQKDTELEIRRLFNNNGL